MYISNHALARYREHWPGAIDEDIHIEIACNKSVSAELVQGLLQRRKPDFTCDYYLSQDVRGIFVVSKDTETVVTYLRLSEDQKKIFAREERTKGPAFTPKKIRTPEEIAERNARKNARSLARYEAERLAELVARYTPIKNREEEENSQTKAEI